MYIILCKIDDSIKAKSLTEKVRMRVKQKQYTYKVEKDDKPFLSDKHLKQKGVPKIGMDRRA